MAELSSKQYWIVRKVEITTWDQLPEAQFDVQIELESENLDKITINLADARSTPFPSVGQTGRLDDLLFGF